MTDKKQQSSSTLHSIPVAQIASYWLRTLAKYIIFEEKKIAPIQYTKYTRKKSNLFSFHVIAIIVQFSRSLLPIPFKPLDGPLISNNSDYYGTIIIDQGSSSIRAGFQGDDEPSVNIPSLIAIKKIANKPDEIIIGNEILNLIKNKTKGIIIKKVIERGKIIELKYIKLIWEYILKQLDITAINVHIIDSKAIRSKTVWENMVQMFFEEMNGESFIIWSAPTMHLYSCGRTTGLIIDCGYGLTQIVPIYEGYILPHAVKVIEWGKYDLDNNIDIDYKIGFKQINIGKYVIECIIKCDSDIRQDLAGNIVIAGGNSMYNDFEDFILDEIKTEMEILMTNQLNIKVICSPERSISSWIGGSILSSVN